MARCPRCNLQVPTPQRTWTMAGRPDQNGFRNTLSVGLFNCPNCRATFRQVLNRTTQPIIRSATDVIVCPTCGHPNARDRDYCIKCETLFTGR